MPLYENVFIARQDLTPSQVESIAGQFEKILKDNGGQIAKRENWGLRPMTYTIKKNKKGYYFLTNIDSSPKAVAEAEKFLRYNEDVLRYLTLRIEEVSQEPSPILSANDEDEESSSYGGKSDRKPRRRE